MARGTWCARLLALSALLPLVACGSDSVEPRRIPAAIVIIPNAPRVAQKATKQLTATVVDAAGREIDGETVAFASSDTTLITVSTTGLLVSVGPLGTATITVSDGELTGTVDAEVTLVPSSVTVTPNPIVLQRGLSQLLSAVVSDANGDPVAGAPLTFTSSDPTLVTVTDFGLVTSVGGDGSATITVTSNALSAAIPVSISQVPTSVVTNPKALVLSPGESQPISATVLDAVGQPIAGAPVTFQSSNAGIVTVSPTGLVHALTLGSATITVSSGSLTATVGVFVGDAPAGTILATVTVPGAPWGAAVASNGDFYVTTVGGPILRGRFPTFAFPTTFSVNSQALWIALNAAHTTAYVAQGYDGVENTGIAIVNIATNSVSDIIPIPSSTTSFAVALSKDEQTLFVGTGDRLLVIDVATRTIVNDNLIPGSVNAISRAPGSDLLYAATLGQVFEISGTARTVLRTLSVPVSSYQETAASLDGTELYVVVEGGDLIVWDLATDQLKRTVTGGGGFGLGLTPDGRFLYVADTYGSKVKIIDRVSGVILRSVNTGGTPRRVAFDPTTGTAMVTNEGGWVDFIK
jgi:YVTN family beta-propeller protein